MSASTFRPWRFNGFSCTAWTRSRRKHWGHGTTGHAIQLLGGWLNDFQKGPFSNQTTYVSGDKVHLGPNNALALTLNAGGVAMIRVKLTGEHWHYILGLHFQGDWLHAFDPYHPNPDPKKNGPPDSYEFLKSAENHAPNLRIHRQWLNAHSNQKPYRLGTKSEREMLLICRTSSR